jgi:low affinity Fe/Cu permease
VTLHALACRLAGHVAAGFAHPLSILLFPALCGVWLLAGGRVDGLTLVLSVLAISTTQLVLLAQARDTAALHQKVDGLLHGVPDADDALAGIERG